MTVKNLPFILNQKSGILSVDYEMNQSPQSSGFDLFIPVGFDASQCVGYPTMRARIVSYAGTGYAAACAWIQLVTRREFSTLDAPEPAVIDRSVDTHPTLAALGVPFFALGFPAQIFDAPCNNLNGLAKLEWVADTFLVTLPGRVNGDSISRLAGFRWGYTEYDEGGKRQVKLNPLVVTGPAEWNAHVPFMLRDYAQWDFRMAEG